MSEYGVVIRRVAGHRRSDDRGRGSGPADDIDTGGGMPAMGDPDAGGLLRFILSS